MADQLLVAPDVVAALIDWAPDALAARGFPGWRVADELRGAKSIAIFRTGGPDSLGGILDLPTITIETLGSTKTASHDALQMLRALIRALVGGYVGGVWVQDYAEFGGPAELPKDSAPDRYTMTLSLTVAARVL